MNRLVKQIILCIISFGFIVTCGSRNISVEAQNIVFPDDAGVINITKPPYNAYGDGIHDDTLAIQQAFDDYINQNRIIYFPNGVYLISDTIEWGPSKEPKANQHKRTILQGQSTKGVTIRLKDNSPGFEDVTVNDKATKLCKGIIWTGQAPAQRFRNAVRNITINSGRENRGACGLQFIANNQGTVRDVRIISEDGQGLYGFDLAYTGQIGPAFIKNLYVEGFDYAIYGHYGNSVTFENLEIEDQNIAGIRHNAPIFIKDLKSSQSKPGIQAVRNESKAGTITIINALLKGNSTDLPAIYNEGNLYARNIVSSGYLKAIENTKSSRLDIKDLTINEFYSRYTSLFDSPNTSLNLVIEETPKVSWEQDLSKWANPLDYGADADDSHSDSAAIQAAIDDPSKTVVYFPAGIKFRIDGEIYIRGNIERIIGTEHAFSPKGVNGKFIFEDGTAETVLFERVMAAYTDLKLVHNASRNLIISSCQGLQLIGKGSGKLFIEDYVGNQEYNNPKMKVFGRSINTEPWKVDEVGITNNGSQVWIFGYKTEGAGTQILTLNGGFTEILGAFIYSTTKTAGSQIFEINESNMSIAGLRQAFTKGDFPYENTVKETRGRETRYLSKDRGLSIPLYTGYEKN